MICLFCQHWTIEGEVKIKEHWISCERVLDMHHGDHHANTIQHNTIRLDGCSGQNATSKILKQSKVHEGCETELSTKN